MNKDKYLIYGIMLGMIVFLLFVFGNTTSADYTITETFYFTNDTYIYEYVPSYHYGDAPDLYVMSRSTNMDRRGLLYNGSWFDTLPEYDGDIYNVINASLHLTVAAKTGDYDGNSLLAYKIASKGIFITQTTGNNKAANWTHYADGSDQMWRNDAGDFDRIMGGDLLSGVGDNNYVINITTTFENWWVDPQNNKGIGLRFEFEENSTMTYVRLWSSDNVGFIVPHVNITYTIKTDYDEEHYYNTSDGCYWYNYSVVNHFNTSNSSFWQTSELISTNATCDPCPDCCSNNSISDYYNISLHNESWVNITIGSWFNNSPCDLEQSYVLNNQWINNSVGGGSCDFPIWIKYRDDNISIHSNVTDCDGTNTTVYKINDDNWIYIAAFDIAPHIMLFIVLTFFFYFAEKKKSPILYFLSTILALVTGVYYLGWETAITDRVIGISLILFAVYCSFTGLLAALKSKVE